MGPRKSSSLCTFTVLALTAVFTLAVAGCGGVSSQTRLQASPSPTPSTSPTPTPTPTPIAQSAGPDQVLALTGLNGDGHMEFAITPSGVAQVGKDITLPTPDQLNLRFVASAHGFMFALDSSTTPRIDSFRSDLTAGTFSFIDATSVNSGVTFLSADPSGTFLYVNDAHDIPPGGYISEMDAFRIMADGSLKRIPGAPFPMFGGPGAGCCAFLVSPLAFTPDGSKAYATIELDCPCHSSPSATWIVQSFQRDPVSDAILMNPTQPLDLPHSFNPIGNVSVLKNGKFVAFPTIDGLMVYAINSTDGSLARVQAPSPVPPVDIDHLYEVVSSTKDGEFVYLTQPNAGRVYGFHVEDDGALTAVPGSPYDMLPADLLVGSSGQFIFVASPGSLIAFQRNLSTGGLTLFGSAPVNTFVRAILNLN